MRQWTIDAFASAPFRGNQGETAFLRRSADPARFGLRWFTPAAEVPLRGLATLASAHALFGELGHAGEAVTFETLSGDLIVPWSSPNQRGREGHHLNAD